MVFAGYGGQGMTWGTPTGTDLVDPPMFENYDNTDGWEQVNDSLTRFLTAAIFMNFARLGHTGDLPATYWRSVHDDVQKQTPLAAFGVYTPQTSQAWIHSDNLLVTKENAFSDNATWVVGAPTPDTITELQSEHGRPSYTKISVSLGKHTGQALHTRWSVSFLPDGSAKLRLTGEGLELPPGSVDFSLLTEEAEAARDEGVSEGHADITVPDTNDFLHVGPSAQGHPITEERAKALTELVLARATRHPEFDEQWSTSRPDIYR